MTQMRAEATFEVASFVPVQIDAALVETAMEAGLAVMEKTYSGAVQGRSSTVFSGGRNAETGAGTYVALEAFTGTVDGHRGAFNFVHAASTHGEDRYADFFSLVDASGTDELAGISGAGGMAVDEDGTHRIWFDYSLD